MRTVTDATMWALPTPLTPDAIDAIAASARACGGRLVMHPRTLDAIRRAYSGAAMSVPRSALEITLSVRIETDIMYPDGIIHAA